MKWSDLPFFQSETHDRLERMLQGENILPPSSLRYRALDLTPFDEVKVVILGQDPYPTRGHANGLAFSVPSSVRPLPPTLNNILTEYSTDLHYKFPRTGSLETWARREVLMLNTCLTVEEGRSGSHHNIGWEMLTQDIVRTISRDRPPSVFILWGNFAKAFEEFIDTSKDLVISSPHPSPLSAKRGFFGTRPFSRANAFLKDRAIDWKLP